MDLKILFVDDDTNLLSSWERNFRRFLLSEPSFKIDTDGNQYLQGAFVGRYPSLPYDFEQIVW